MTRRLVTVTASVIIVVSLLVAAHVVLAFHGPGTDSRRVGAQVAWLDTQLRDGAGRRMQAFFPEGDLFTNVLTGMAAAQLAVAGSPEARASRLATARYALTEVDQPRTATCSGRSPSRPTGSSTGAGGCCSSSTSPPPAAVPATWRPWTTGRARCGMPSTRRRPGCSSPIPASTGPATAWSASRRWSAPTPCSARLAHRAAPLDALCWAASTRCGTGQPACSPTGPTAGRPLDGPRGSSQSLIQVFLPDIDDARAQREWTAYKSAFLVRELGLVGVREYPVGATGAGDADSGPLVLGVSASASAVTLGAARRNGDVGLADSLDHEAEMLGLGLQWGGERRYALGQLPVGDAFLAWARTRPAASPQAVQPSPAPLWPVYLLLALLPAAVAAALLLARGRAAGRRGPATQAPR